jgi:phosphoadenosine phosphosulfate reductase
MSNDVPRTKLLDQGYKSVGDWHSTERAGEGGGERDGRWKGSEKTECGLHVDIIQVKKVVDEKTSVNVTTVLGDLNGNV